MTAREKVALVTGANRGIGLEIARGLARRGYHVVATARRPEALEPMRAELALDGDVTARALDVTSDDSVQAVAAWLRQQCERLDVLVNNAGVAPDQWQSGLEVDLDLVQLALETNFVGVLRCCQAMIPLMRDNGYGRVVNLSTELASLEPMELGSTLAYRTSKTALNALTRLLALELKDESNIKINAACPGWVKTELGGPDAIYTVEEGADTPLWLATLSDDGPSGGLFRQREPYPW